MKTISIQRLSLIGFAILMLGSLLSGALLITLLFNYTAIKERQQISKTAYDALFAYKYKTEHLLVTNNVTKEVTKWEEAFTLFHKHFLALEAILPGNIEDLDRLMQSITKAKNEVENQLRNPLFSDRNVMEKSLLRRLGEGLNANETSPYYIAVRDLINAVDFLKQYEDFLLHELYLLDQTTQQEGNVRLERTRDMAVITPFVAFGFTLIVGVLLWRRIGSIERTLEEQRDRLDYIAYHDYLTKLANRAQFISVLEKTLLNAKAKGLHVGLLFLDLDRFKEINDSFGHSVGDVVLCEIAERLKATVAHNALIARLGGDEFTLIVEGMHSEALAKIAHTIITMIQKPLYIHKTEIYLTCSVGISLYPTDASDAETLLRNVDTAMYEAKNEGKNTFHFYNQSMTDASVAKLQMENQLRKAIDEGSLELHYQPQIDSEKGVIWGVEALLRWNDTVLGSVSPAVFIPLAEETGLILPLGNWVLHEAIKQQSLWLKQGIAPQIVAVNIAAKQIYHTDLAGIVQGLLERYVVPPSMLELEITERIIVENPQHATDVLNTLRLLGVRISMDDFGTGYSSLSYLKTLPIDKIKIDQSFIKGIPHTKEDGEIVKTIIRLAKGLGLYVIAEGVERLEQAHFLQSEGCYEMQGYLYAKPMNALALEAFMQTFRYDS
jgi:diguanylate cyclase (GGDEF)-like protein